MGSLMNERSCKNGHSEIYQLAVVTPLEQRHIELPSSSEPSVIISTTPKRQLWGSRAEFFLSLLGYAVSLGNVWRFPYLCYRNGGGAFLIPYTIMLFVCGIPLFFLEVALGQFAREGAINVWNFCPLFKGVGIGTVLLTAIGSTSYNLLVALILFFLFSSFGGNGQNLPWGTCDNKWNTNSCIVLRQTNLTILRDLKDFHTVQTSTYEFWNKRVLQISDGLHNMGDINLKLMACFLLAWIITFTCLIGGIRSTGKIVYFTATFPYLILTVLLVRSLTLPGALDGVIFFLKPKWRILRTFKVWNEAATQIFYSLGPGWGGLITMASHNKFNHNCLRDSLLVPLINCGTSVYAGLVVFSIVGFMSQVLIIPIEKVAAQGVSLAFITYPEALLHLPFAKLWSILFFLMMLSVGVDTMFVQMEVVYSAIYEELPTKLKTHKVLFNLVASVIMFLMGIPFLYQGGIYLFQLVDWYLALLSVMIFCIFETCTITWIYGGHKFFKDIEFMLRKKVYGATVTIFLWKYLIPLMLAIALVFNVVFYVPVQYDTYNYTSWALSMGWIISITSLLPIPITAIYCLFKTEGKTFLQKISRATEPSKTWGQGGEALTYDYNDLQKKDLTLLKEPLSRDSGELLENC